ncbi:hypothetical protein GY45DRAFT_1319964 [Cubamyces sp. BRFM 1775]|nr:hypothetical protein GY45DRAFT_1319964 [Cubamyces sp. BRFM 1775]
MSDSGTRICGSQDLQEQVAPRYRTTLSTYVYDRLLRTTRCNPGRGPSFSARSCRRYIATHGVLRRLVTPIIGMFTTTMYYLASSVAFVLLGTIVRATPVPSPEANAPFLVIAGLDVASPPGAPGQTLPGGGAPPPSRPIEGSLVVRQSTYPANLFTCTQANCVGCTSWDLQGRNEGNCYFAGQFISVIIEQPSNAGLPYSVDIAPGNCTNWLSIPTVNTCYNINGAVFEQFGLDT